MKQGVHIHMYTMFECCLESVSVVSRSKSALDLSSDPLNCDISIAVEATPRRTAKTQTERILMQGSTNAFLRSTGRKGYSRIQESCYTKSRQCEYAAHARINVHTSHTPNDAKQYHDTNKASHDDQKCCVIGRRWVCRAQDLKTCWVKPP